MLLHIILAIVYVGIGVLLATAYFLAKPLRPHHQHKDPYAMIIAAFQPSIDANTAAAESLNASATAIAALLANPILPPGAADATDVSDTAAALSTSSEAVTAAAAAVAAAIPAPAAPVDEPPAS